MALYPARAMERAMRIQEVILRAVSGEILWSQAAIRYRQVEVRTGRLSECKANDPAITDTDFLPTLVR
jgi:hypothetical protein